MKLIHLSDLHLGKRVNGFSMLKDQEYILDEILSIIDVECPDAVLIAGDVYDKSIPPAEAVDLLDFFLVETLPMYMPGRTRTASSPSRTVMLEASYVFVSVFAIITSRYTI